MGASIRGTRHRSACHTTRTITDMHMSACVRESMWTTMAVKWSISVRCLQPRTITTQQCTTTPQCSRRSSTVSYPGCWFPFGTGHTSITTTRGRHWYCTFCVMINVHCRSEKVTILSQVFIMLDTRPRTCTHTELPVSDSANDDHDENLSIKVWKLTRKSAE